MKLRHHLCATLLASSALVSAAAPALAAVPSALTEQGRLFDAAGSPRNGVVSLKFAVYASPTGGVALWSETQTVTLDEGYFSAARVLRTSNGAHWTGRRFTAAVNQYTTATNSGYPHKYHDVLDVQAGPSGCSGGLTSFDGASGVFSFVSGNCLQNIRLVCTNMD